jgi:PAS domain S-box-containing protein
MSRFDGKEKRTLTIFIFIFVLLTAGIAIGGYLSYRNYEAQFRAQAEHQLSSIAELKVNELVNWRKEQLADAELLHQNPVFATLVRAYFEDPQDTLAQAQIQAWLEEYRIFPDYDRVRLLDPQGQTRLSDPGGLPPISSAVAKRIPEVLQSKQVVLLDFYRRDGDGQISLCLLMPILDAQTGKQAIGLVALSINPQTYLYPFIQSWPVPSTSAETLLIRREGNEALYLNELRFNPQAALTLRFPLTKTELPAVKAVLGQSGVMEGVDYRGMSVVADVRAVPGSPWFLVSKMDIAEVYAPLKARLQSTFWLIGAAIFVVGTGLAAAWRQQRLQYYRTQVEAAEALRESEKKYQVLTEISPVGIFKTDAQGTTTYVNPRWSQISGLSADEALGDGWLRAVHPEDRENLSAGWKKAISTQIASVIEYRFVRPDGSIAWVLGQSILERNIRNRIVGYVGTITDITEQKRAELQLAHYAEKLEGMVDERTLELKNAQEQLVRQERLATLGQLAGSIGHELRNPLGVISNAVYFLKIIQPDASEKVKEYLDIIENETKTSDKIITDLLDFTRIKSLDRQPVAVSELIHQTLEHYPAPPSVEVALEIAPDLPLVYVDPQHIRQVLGNLTVNACQAMENIGKITISAAAQGDMIHITVQDTGQGIPPEHMEKLFEPLFTTKIKGIGLGLAVSRKLAAANGGRIEVQSEPEKGSTFTVVLPTYKEPK